MDANEVDWYTRQRHSYSYQRVDGVAVEGHHHKEYGAQAKDDWEEQRQLEEAERGKEEEKSSERLGRKTVQD